MPWNEVAPGRFQRSLDNLERFLCSMTDIFSDSGREHWAVNIVGRLRFEEISETQLLTALRQAWISTRYHYPLIAATVDGEKHVYQSPSPEQLESWLAESLVIHNDETTEEFLPSAKLTTYSSLHFFPTSSEILMRTHHWQIDGIGALHLLDCFLKLFSAAVSLPEFGEESQRLPPSHSEAVPLPSGLSSQSHDAAQRLLAVNPANVPSIGLETSSNVPGGTQRSKLTFTPSSLNQLVAACRDSGLSVTSVVHAAVVLATQEMAAISTRNRDFASLAFFNHRPYLHAPYSDSKQWPMGCWMVALPFSLMQNDFLTQARALQKIYKQPLDLDDCPVLQYYDRYVGMAADALLQPLPNDTPTPLLTQPQLSSLGVVDGRVQHTYKGKQTITVEEIEPFLDIMSASFLVFQWSWRGKFMINVCYNENYYEKAYVDRFLTKLKVILAKGMKIDMQCDI
ncbi:MAG: hypothetical protein Q9227_004817 [Pyrenula ochraceoflavens]